MPPQFTFDLFVTLVKFGEKPIIISKRTLDVYMGVIQHVAYNMCYSYITDGWRIYKIELLNYEYHIGVSNDGIHI
jgi:hypothetical protein